MRFFDLALIRSAPRISESALVALATLLVASPARPGEVFFVSDCLEASDGLLVGAYTQPYPGGIGVRDPVFSNLGPCSALPAVVGSDADEYYSGQVDFELSTDGGVTWGPAHAPVTFHVGYHYTGLAGPDTRHFDTEMLQLDISGGTLPYTLAFRESPILVSNGLTLVRAVPGGFMIDSFFDVFTEMSPDGAIWYPAGQASHLALSSEHATPVRATSWGRIKTLYR